MEEINLILDIDDLNPTKLWGEKMDESNYRYIHMLKDEFLKLKTTIFVPANFENKADLRLKTEWTDWLKRLKDVEIASHGCTHMNQTNKKDGREFFNSTPWETEFKLKESKKIFNEVGINVKGIKAGGWDIDNYFYNIASKYYNYIADHFIGFEPQKVKEGFYSVPYTYSIDDIGPKYYNNMLLHGHINTERGSKNGLNKLLYNYLRNYLKELESKFKVNYLTMGELVEKYEKN